MGIPVLFNPLSSQGLRAADELGDDPPGAPVPYEHAVGAPGSRWLFVVGLSHRTAPVEIREALLLGRDELALRVLLQQTAALCGEAMILSTCNRVELYGSIPGSDSPGSAGGKPQEREQAELLAKVETLLTEQQPQARPYLYRLSGEAALRHLFRVTSSLDSMVLGEPQILGQVKAAYQSAGTAGTIGAVLGAIVPRALAVAKLVRSETPIGQSAASVASVAVELARQTFGELRGQPVMLLGAGKMAMLCARHLQAAGATHFLVANRTLSHAAELAAQLGGTAHGLDELESLLAQSAVVICSAGAPEPLLRTELVERAMKARRQKWLLLIDISVPRDVEPQAARLDNVYLYDIDALSSVVAGNLDARQRAAEAAELLVEAELQRTLARSRSTKVAPTIRALRERAHAIAEAEVTRVLPRLGALCDHERAQALLRGLADAVVNKLLHEPLTALRRDAGEGPVGGGELVAAVHRLWSLGAAAADPREGTEATIVPPPLGCPLGRSALGNAAP